MTRLRAADDRGSTLIAVVLVTVVLLVMGGTVLRMSDHTNESTTLDRLRVQALQAAEAGANAAIKRLEVNPSCDATVGSPISLTAGSRTLARYRVRVDEEPGTGCTSDNRIVRSWGTAPSSSGRSLRQVEVTVRLIPQDAFHFTLFASGQDGTVTVKNTGTVGGDVYAESLDQSQNNIVADDVISPGSIDTRNGALYTGTLWAGGNVTLRQNGSVGGSVLAAGVSAPGNVVIENGVAITRDVKARGTVSLPTVYTIGGGLSHSDPLVLPPPVLDKPTFAWDPADYSPAPKSFTSAGVASTRLYSLRDNLQGTFHVDDPSGTVTTDTAAASYKVTGPLTIVTSGRLVLGRTFTHVGGPWPMLVVSTSPAPDAISLPKPTSFSSGLHVLLFASTGGVDIRNQTSLTGAIYANRIELNNTLAISRSSLLENAKPPGFDWSNASAARFTVVPLTWREVAPQAP